MLGFIGGECCLFVLYCATLLSENHQEPITMQIQILGEIAAA